MRKSGFLPQTWPAHHRFAMATQPAASQTRRKLHQRPGKNGKRRAGVFFLINQQYGWNRRKHNRPKPEASNFLKRTNVADGDFVARENHRVNIRPGELRVNLARLTAP